MGGINTFMWHCDDPATKASAFDRPDGGTVCKILEPGSKAHQVFNRYLDKLADFFKKLKILERQADTGNFQAFS